LFPKPGDSPDGGDYRNQLITVPSCNIHNTETSRDDEYLAYTLAMGITANTHGKHQFRTKVMRAIEKNQSLIKKLLGTRQNVVVHDKVSGSVERTIAFRVDDARLCDIFSKIARGLWFHEMESVWPGTVLVLPEYILSLEDVEGNAQTQQVVRSLDSLLQSAAHKGANPAIFFYQVASHDDDHVIRLHFYQDARVTCILRRVAG
jgi:hypothetical protein